MCVQVSVCACVCACFFVCMCACTPRKFVCVCVFLHKYTCGVCRTINTTDGLYSIRVVGYKIALVGNTEQQERTRGSVPHKSMHVRLCCVCVCVCVCTIFMHLLLTANLWYILGVGGGGSSSELLSISLTSFSEVSSPRGLIFVTLIY